MVGDSRAASRSSGAPVYRWEEAKDNGRSVQHGKEGVVDPAASTPPVLETKIITWATERSRVGHTGQVQQLLKTRVRKSVTDMIFDMVLFMIFRLI